MTRGSRLWRLVNDGRPLAPRVTVGLTLAVAFLSIVTGIVTISSIGPGGPFAAFVPAPIRQTAGFTGVLTGFLVALSAVGLRRGLRVAWYATIALLPLTALQGLLQSSLFSLPLVVFSLLGLSHALYTRDRFARSLSLSTTQLAAVVALVGAQAYGTVGTYVLRDDFSSVETLVDAFYYTLVTASTVGYGDVTPASQSARLFGLSVIVLGTASFALALGTLIAPLFEARVARIFGRMTGHNYDLLENHLLVLGYGELTDAIIDTLSGDTEYVVVTDDSQHVSQLTDRGIDVYAGSPSDEAPLLDAGVKRAQAAIVATNDDGADSLAVLTARDLNPELRIVAAATKRENIHKLERAGADEVISPTTLGAQMLVQSSGAAAPSNESD